MSRQLCGIPCISSSASPPPASLAPLHLPTLAAPTSFSPDKQVVEPLVRGVLSGTNGALLTVGAAGSGKAHTLFGSRDAQARSPISPDCP